MQNWKITLLAVLLFTFVALPSIGQEMDIPSLKKLDPLTWGSEILLAEEELEVHPVSEDEIKDVHSLAGDYSTESSDKKEDGWFLHFLRKIFSSAMKF